MPRRASLFVILGFAVALVLVTGISAGAQSGGIKAQKADVAAAQDRLMEIRVEASAAEASYNNALYEMNQLNGQIAKTKDDLDGARKRFKAAKKSLEERAALVYKSQNVAFMDVLVGVDSFSEFATRLDLWVRLLGRERADFVKVREAKKDLLAHKDKLEAEHEQRIAAVERAMDQKKQAEKAEAQAEAYLDSLNADLRASIEAAQNRRAEQAQAAAAAIVEPASKPDEKGKPAPKPAPKPVPVAVPESQPEPIPEVEASQVKQVPVPKPDLSSE
jgi:peptidoglycan DL-endopeptidase RipA